MKNNIKLENLKKTVENLQERERKFLDKNDKTDECNLYGYLGSNCFFYGMHSYYVENDIEKAKDYFSLQCKYKLLNSQLSSAESIRRLFWVGRTLICNVGISDNQDLIKKFANYNYPIYYESRGKKITTDFKTVVKQGEDSICSELMLNAINCDSIKLEENLEIFKKITLKKKINEKMKMDLFFYESLISGNREKIENSLVPFLTKREHNYRNQHDLFPELISYPVVGYIKIALLNGIDVELQNDYIPMDLLYVKPNDKYSNIIDIK